MTTRRGTRTVGGWVERAAPLLFGVALTALAAKHLPLPADDPLRVVLVWLPAIVGALLAIERTPGARSLTIRSRRIDLAALTVLTLFALVRGDLGIRYSTPLVSGSVVAGYAALLGYRVLRQILALRPLLGRRLTGRPPWIVFWLFAAVYLAVLPWCHRQRPPDGDEPYYLLLAQSLAWDQDVDLADDYADESYREFVDRPLEPQPGDPTGPNGEIYSRHNALLPVVLAPAYRFFGPRGALATLCLLSALLVWCTLRLSRHYVADRPGEALAACSVLGLTPPVLLFSHQAWAELPAALLLVLALDAALSLGNRRNGPAWPAWLRFAVPLLLLPMLKLRFLPLVASLVFLVAWRSPARRRRTILWLAGGLAVFVAGLLLVNLALYGNPLKYYKLAVLATYLNAPTAYLRGAAGLFFDCAFGLFAAAPVWALLLPAIPVALRRQRKLAGHVALVASPYLLAIVPRGEWFGAWSPPFRYGVALLPMFALLLVPLFVERRSVGARLGSSSLILATLGVTVLAISVPGWTYNLADGRTQWLDRLSALLGHDLARFLPSYLRFRLASWVWPPLLAGSLALAWALPRRARRVPWIGATTLLLLLCAGTVWAAVALPTRIVELEDPWVDHHGGQLHPDRWRVGRVRFRGAWVFESDAVVTVPIVPGGRRVRISASVRSPDPARPARALLLTAGGTVLATLPVTEGDTWRRIELPDVDWPADAGELQVLAANPDGADVAPALVDRLDLEWDP